MTALEQASAADARRILREVVAGLRTKNAIAQAIATMERARTEPQTAPPKKAAEHQPWSRSETFYGHLDNSPIDGLAWVPILATSATVYLVVGFEKWIRQTMRSVRRPGPDL